MALSDDCLQIFMLFSVLNINAKEFPNSCNRKLLNKLNANSDGIYYF